METGVFRIRLSSKCGGNFWAMKILNRTLLGVISCFLLSAGLAKAAQQIDPLSKTLTIQGPHSGAADVGAMTCTEPCDYQPIHKSQ